MRADPGNVERGTRILFAAHYLERIGDRVTNIAEDVVFLASRRDRGPEPVSVDPPIRVARRLLRATRRGASWPRRCSGSTAAPTSTSYSAGIEPKGVNPLTIRVLDEAGIDHAWARSKSVDEFLGQSFDYVITVCDEARHSLPGLPRREPDRSTGATRTRPRSKAPTSSDSPRSEKTLTLMATGSPVHPARPAGAGAARCVAAAAGA